MMNLKLFFSLHRKIIIYKEAKTQHTSTYHIIDVHLILLIAHRYNNLLLFNTFCVSIEIIISLFKNFFFAFLCRGQSLAIYLKTNNLNIYSSSMFSLKHTQPHKFIHWNCANVEITRNIGKRYLYIFV